ncbi:serine/threonine-protein kinase [Phytopseudomonas dryadis]|uniref:Serine/threonine protein kinase n=1 Tax=Phytopseudomonas dryadis TaxID=2487520 RepID=A0ABY1Z386_9GAMM|nr:MULTISPECIES: serine/threonine-protein kinase [Pseudomonas]TBV01107.1 serine/threonine protein kinase [Pseudomonas dryadis]TBV13817.1 serine/threonine protein kinase [Pseudomonas sp. FRB 230]
MDMEIPGYDIERELGDGAMAVVYLATQRSLERKVALKVMAAALAADPTFCERFLREGRTLARLSHPNTVTIHDIGNVGNLYYMAMEYLPNGTLKERISAGLSVEQGLVWLRQIASALGYAHAQGMVHRDVKPANILFRADGTAVLSDFGIAKALDDRTQFTQAGFAVGTPSYMSPEQARGLDIDGRADLYAVGVVLYEILTGKLPYVGTDSLSTVLAHLTEPLPELPMVHGRYQPILERLLAKDPNDRFANAEQLIAALDALAVPAPGDQDDADATRFQPLVLPASAEAPTAITPAPLAAVSIEVPTHAPAAEPAQPARAAPSQPSPLAAAVRQGHAGSSRTPLILGASLAAVLLLAGGAYWLFSGTSEQAGDTPPIARIDTEQGAATSVAGGADDSADGGQRPLLMSGKKTLFQRVLTKPGAQLVDAAGASGGKEVPAFSVFYVYARQEVNGQPWVQVGAASDGRRDGWMPADTVSDWKQSLVLKFTERSGRAPVMFVRDASALEQLLAEPARAREALREALEGSAQNVVAVEPGDSAVPQDQFYLLPIFASAETFDASGQPLQLLNIASIDPGNTPQVRGDGPPVARPDAFRTAIVLVVDTSVSMQPYIDRVRDVVHELQGQIASRGDLDSVSFGMVGFRSNTDKTPGLEYTAKTLVSLEEGRDPERFLQLAQQIKATGVSSHDFNEDAFAGIMEAVDGMDWNGYGGRLILLVSDAGALRKSDPLGSTRMNEAEVREAALRKQIKIYALHLKTEAGKRNHGFAEQQYRSLTADANPRIGDLYIPVAGGDVKTFGDSVAEIGSAFADLVHQVRNDNSLPEPTGGSSIAAKSAAVGYAMHMDFLGHQSEVRAPQVVTAWTSDRDITDPALPAFQVCVLLTKLQLNDLQQALRMVVDAARRTQSSPKDFFQEIASASAHMSRDPSGLVKGDNLAQSGILGEYLDDLPYRSKALNMSQDLWLSLSVAEQEDFIDELDSKIQLYETFHNDTANWVRFGDAAPGDALYRVPLSTLP